MSEYESYQEWLLKVIASSAFSAMEGCDEPEFSALSAIYEIARNPDVYYEHEMNVKAVDEDAER